MMSWLIRTIIYEVHRITILLLWLYNNSVSIENTWNREYMECKVYVYTNNVSPYEVQGIHVT